VISRGTTYKISRPGAKAPSKNKNSSTKIDRHKARWLMPANIVLKIIYFALGQPRIIKIIASKMLGGLAKTKQ
jgi:hypothetical protein